MIQLRYLETVSLNERNREISPNGSLVETYPKIEYYQVQVQDINDEVSASIYGADMNHMIRVASPHQRLEKLLKTKVNFTADNVTNYCIQRGSFIYEIVSVKEHFIDLKVLCEIYQN